WRWESGTLKHYPIAGEPEPAQALSEDDDGTLLLGLPERISRLVDGKTEAYPLPAGVLPLRITKMFRDRDGGLWIGTVNRGLVHVHRGRTDIFSSADGLSGDDVGTIFEDSEGSIWVATNGGVDRFRSFAISTFSTRQGLSSDIVYAVLAARDGTVW